MAELTHLSLFFSQPYLKKSKRQLKFKKKIRHQLGSKLWSMHLALDTSTLYITPTTKPCDLKHFKRLDFRYKFNLSSMLIQAGLVSQAAQLWLFFVVQLFLEYTNT